MPLSEATQQKRARIQHALETLRQLLPEGGVMYGKFIYGTSSGGECYSFCTIHDGRLVDLDSYVALICDLRLSDKKRTGLGVLVGYSLTTIVDSMSLAMYGKHQALVYARM